MGDIREGRLRVHVSGTWHSWSNRCVHTLVDRFSLYPGCPAASIVTSGNLEELGGNLDVVGSVLDDLHAAFARIILHPRVSVQSVTLVACVTRPCVMTSASTAEVVTESTVRRTSDGLEVLRSKPHEPRHQRLRYSRTQAKVQAGTIGSPEERVRVVARLREYRGCQRQ